MEQKGYKIQSRYNVTADFEISVDANGWNFVVIYGHHANGGYCCIPGWNVGCEMSLPDDTLYNATRLRGAVRDWKDCIEKRALRDVADDLAMEIKEMAQILETGKAQPIEKTIFEEMEESAKAKAATSNEDYVEPTEEELQVETEIFQKAEALCAGREFCADCSEKGNLDKFVDGCSGRAAIQLILEARKSTSKAVAE